MYVCIIKLCIELLLSFMFVVETVKIHKVDKEPRVKPNSQLVWDRMYLVDCKTIFVLDYLMPFLSLVLYVVIVSMREIALKWYGSINKNECIHIYLANFTLLMLVINYVKSVVHVLQSYPVPFFRKMT